MPIPIAVAGDRAVVRSIYHRGDGDGSGRVPGGDLFVVRGSEVSGKCSYVSG